MSTFAEIQEAIIALPETQRHALSAWLASQNPPQIAAEDETLLLRSLDDAIRDLDHGKGVSLSAARKLVRTWAGK
jgi:hypothetical protein